MTPFAPLIIFVIVVVVGVCAAAIWESEQQRKENEASAAGVVADMLLNTPVQGGYAPRKPSLRRRLLQRFFPHTPCPVLDVAHAINSHVHINFDWKDRLRVLLTGRVEVTVRVEIDANADPVRSTAIANVVLED